VENYLADRAGGGGPRQGTIPVGVGHRALAPAAARRRRNRRPARRPSGATGTYILIGELVSVAFTAIAIRRDRRALATAGETMGRAWAWFPLIPWIYLWARAARRARRANADWRLADPGINLRQRTPHASEGRCANAQPFQ
jgi:hypothetical protein